jgi:hypothetical protein
LSNLVFLLYLSQKCVYIFQSVVRPVWFVTI